jgi:hypothetical protein
LATIRLSGAPKQAVDNSSWIAISSYSSEIGILRQKAMQPLLPTVKSSVTL